LFELLDDRSGRCPRCNWTLTHDWTHALLDDASRADIAQRHLVGALRGVGNLPGNIIVRPVTVLRNLFEEVGWQRHLAAHPQLLRAELAELRRLVTAWELLDPVVADAQPRRNWLQRTVDLILGRRPEPLLAPTETTPITAPGPSPQPDTAVHAAA
jgi:hypothetical protein